MAKNKKDIPQVLADGLDLYLEKSAADAIAFWSQGSAQDGQGLLDEKAKSLRQVEYAHGKFTGYKVKEVQVITPTAHLIFLSLQYEQTEIPARFLAYKQGQNWILANFLFDISLQTTKAFLV